MKHSSASAPKLGKRFLQALAVALALQPGASPIFAADAPAAADAAPATTETAPATPAASAPKPAASAAAADTETVRLDAVSVEGSVTDSTVLPTRPSRSLYGFEELIRETPRSIFQISKAQLDADNIRNFTDFSRYSPSIRRGTTSTYSIANIRGSTGDTARNGTILFNPALRPFDNNAWESVDIVAGVPSVSQGATARTAGYVNYVTKKPYFDGDHTKITTQAGRVGTTPATSYNQYSFQLDHSLVLIKDELAARVSAQRTESEQYWNGSDGDFKDLYGAVTWKPNKKVTVDFNFTYLASEGGVPWGINRIDQRLIDDWSYRTGDYVPRISYPYTGTTTNPSVAYTYSPSLGGWRTSQTAAGAVEFPLGSEPWNSPSNYGKLSFVAPEGYGTERRTIEGNEVVQGTTTYDNNKATEYIGQVTTTVELNEHFTFVNRTSYQYINNNNHKYDYYYSEHPNKLFETRFELQTNHDFTIAGKAIRHQSNSGFSYRHLVNTCDAAVSNLAGSNATDYTDIFGPYGLDLSTKLSSSVYKVLPDDLLGVHPINLGNPGDPGVNNRGVIQTGYGYVDWEPSWWDGGTLRSLGVASGGGQTGFSSWYDRRENTLRYHSLFTDHKIDVGKNFTVRLAGRLSYIADNAEHTNLTKSYFDSGVFHEDARVKKSDSYYGWNGQFDASVSYHPVSWLNIYATYDYSQTITGCGCCEADGWSSSGANVLDPNHFQTPSDLIEFGVKTEILPNSLFANFAYFRQTRTDSYTDPITRAIRNSTQLFDGLEFSVTYQPTAHATLGANYSYIHVTSKTTGTRSTGQPLSTFNVWGSYQWSNGFGAKATFWVTSEWNVTSSGSVRVPVQYNLDLGVFYTRKVYSGILRADLDILNATDEKGWSPSGGIGGNSYTYLLPLERLGAQLKVSYSF
jgi:hypothetical protein